jgi:hypothetical protein
LARFRTYDIGEKTGAGSVPVFCFERGGIGEREKGRQSMDSGMIGKIEKAKRYAEQPDRILFQEFKVTVNGDHDNHLVCFSSGQWSCDCGFFAKRGVCSHTMALERVLGVMLPATEEIAASPV